MDQEEGEDLAHTITQNYLQPAIIYRDCLYCAWIMQMICAYILVFVVTARLQTISLWKPLVPYIPHRPPTAICILIATYRQNIISNLETKTIIIHKQSFRSRASRTFVQIMNDQAHIVCLINNPGGYMISMFHLTQRQQIIFEIS